MCGFDKLGCISIARNDRRPYYRKYLDPVNDQLHLLMMLPLGEHARKYSYRVNIQLYYSTFINDASTRRTC